MHLTGLAPRRLAMLVAALGVFSALALVPMFSTQPAGAAGRAAAMPRCASSGLVVWLATQGNAAAGSVYYQLQFTNLSGHGCTLRGYPGVSAIGLNAHQLGRAASREAGASVTTVALPAGATAIAMLRIVEAGNFPPAACRQTEAAGLRIYPPGQRASKVVPFPFEACSRSGPSYLSISPIRKGS